MKVLFIGALPPPITGQALACKVLYEHLAGQNEVVVINMSRKGLSSGDIVSGRLAEVVHIVFNILRNRNSDLIYLTVSESVLGMLKDILIYLVCLGRLEKVIIHLHGGAGMRQLLTENPIFRWLHKLILHRLGGVIILGDLHQDIYKNLIQSNKVFVVPNFAEDYVFQLPELIDKKFSENKKIRVLFLSNLLPGKGHLELVAAIKKLPPEFRILFEFNFAGGFESKSDHDLFIDSISHVDEIKYHGVANQDLKCRLFHDAHIFCLPTYYAYEGQPISILEAYASGCVVITTNHSGIFDIFAPDRNGFLVQKRDVGSIIEALYKTISLKDKLQGIARFNLDQANNLYRSNVFIDRMDFVIKNITNINSVSAF